MSISYAYIFLHRQAHASNRWQAHLVPALYSSQYLMSQLCKCVYFLHCRRSVRPSDSRRTLTVTNVAWLCSSWISLYRLRRSWFALAFRQQCQPSNVVICLHRLAKHRPCRRWLARRSTKSMCDQHSGDVESALGGLLTPRWNGTLLWRRNAIVWWQIWPTDVYRIHCLKPNCLYVLPVCLPVVKGASALCHSRQKLAGSLPYGELEVGHNCLDPWTSRHGVDEGIEHACVVLPSTAWQLQMPKVAASARRLPHKPLHGKTTAWTALAPL